mmetsp:Transcript_11832/g.17633  ORF Transcript_11832/g.17633 Transcript_11832/m.17633 type:complete len:593 (+) Transcript_11832:124-1902(+)
MPTDNAKKLLGHRAPPGKRKVRYITDRQRRASAATNLKQTIMRKMAELEIKCGTKMLVAFYSSSNRLKTFSYGPTNFASHKFEFDQLATKIFTDNRVAGENDFQDSTRDELRSIYRSTIQSIFGGRIPNCSDPDCCPSWMPSDLWMAVDKMDQNQLRRAIGFAVKARTKKGAACKSKVKAKSLRDQSKSPPSSRKRLKKVIEASNDEFEEESNLPFTDSDATTSGSESSGLSPHQCSRERKVTVKKEIISQEERESDISMDRERKAAVKEDIILEYERESAPPTTDRVLAPNTFNCPKLPILKPSSEFQLAPFRFPKTSSMVELRSPLRSPQKEDSRDHLNAHATGRRTRNSSGTVLFPNARVKVPSVEKINILVPKNSMLWPTASSNNASSMIISEEEEVKKRGCDASPEKVVPSPSCELPSWATIQSPQDPSSLLNGDLNRSTKKREVDLKLAEIFIPRVSKTTKRKRKSPGTASSSWGAMLTLSPALSFSNQATKTRKIDRSPDDILGMQVGCPLEKLEGRSIADSGSKATTPNAIGTPMFPSASELWTKFAQQNRNKDSKEMTENEISCLLEQLAKENRWDTSSSTKY